MLLVGSRAHQGLSLDPFGKVGVGRYHIVFPIFEAIL
jgi:hypothetical protein